MDTKIFQKIKKILSVVISIVFWTFIVAEIFALIWEVLDMQSFLNTNLEEIMKFRLHMSVMWLLVCLTSIWSNKKVLMLVWIMAWWYMGSLFMIFSVYNQYAEKENCLDNGYVWDYNENRCREDCLSWDKTNGCIKMTVE